MIKDENNCRSIYFGHGTVSIGKDKLGTTYLIREQLEKREITGKFKKAKNVGEPITNAPEKTVALYFDGPHSIDSIDMMIEDLVAIKKELINSRRRGK